MRGGPVLAGAGRAVTLAAAGTSRGAMLRLAWPIVVANSAAPLLGLVDTAVIGNLGTAVGLGAIALGSLVASFVYWTFGFLRMGTTGFVAQASGADDSAEVRAAVLRALLLGGAIGVFLVLLQRPIEWIAFGLLGASPEVEQGARGYIEIRIWGAPAALATYALVGALVGLARTGYVLAVQLVLNGLNIALDLTFAGWLGWGVRGVALGTVASEWVTLLVAAGLLARLLRDGHRDAEPIVPWARILDRAKALRTLAANADILARTFFLLLGFAWFTNASARLDDTTLAANHVLLQLISLSAYLLDGYAHATEIWVGRAVGTRSLETFDSAARSATELAAASAAVLGGGIFVLGDLVTAVLTDIDAVRQVASRHLPYAATYVVVSFAAFQLDGIFVGATRTRDMRDASIASFLVFVCASLLLLSRFGNAGLWCAFVMYVSVRAVTLGVRVPALRATLRGGQVSRVR